MQFPNIKALLEGYWRVLRLTKKPTLDDYSFTAKICAAGMLVIGVIGFALYLTAILLGL
ncbi:MAG TPA: protein translocase SEC61 complex subunit gamma [archaeon]|nr:protein translocase SEC61 complex subunit gamma [archaeon]